MSDPLVWFFLAVNMLAPGGAPERSASFARLIDCEVAAVQTMRANAAVYVLPATGDNRWSCHIGPAAATVNIAVPR